MTDKKSIPTAADMEQKFREELATCQRELGREHPDTLRSRSHLAVVLHFQGKDADAEKEFRTVLTGQQRAFGPAHPDVFRTCNYLAACLRSQGKFPEALEFAQQVEQDRTARFGADHPFSKRARELREQIEAESKKKRSKNGSK